MQDDLDVQGTLCGRPGSLTRQNYAGKITPSHFLSSQALSPLLGLTLSNSRLPVTTRSLKAAADFFFRTGRFLPRNAAFLCRRQA